MTTPIATEVSARRGRPPKVRAPSPFAALANVARKVVQDAAAANATGGSGSLSAAERAYYRERPADYFRDVLGVNPWRRQLEIIAAVKDFPRVAVASGHKVSKSHTAAGIALWFYDCFPDARVVMSSTTARQVDQILWRELRMMRARATRPVLGDMHELARNGLKSSDFREIVGFTAREAEAVAGISGKNLLYILDEASGIGDAIYEAIEGNRAGGARILLFSNPTRTEGEFFEAFTSKVAIDVDGKRVRPTGYKCIRVSSEETPNVVEGREVVPGLATRGWIEEKRAEWGEDSPLYKIRVKGEFVLNETGKILSVDAITRAEERWAEASSEGRLHVGIDPAGPGQGGDESAFALRRGVKVTGIYALRGLTEGAHLAHLLGFLSEHRKAKDETPLVKVDREGPIGSAVFGILRAHVENHPNDFQVVGVRSSDRAMRQPNNYDRVRDELWANLAQWIREGGAIPTDTKLAKELHAPEWEGQVTGRLKVTNKDDLRKVLGRSPDRADAIALAVWEQAAWSAARVDNAAPPPPQESRSLGMDPYAGLSAWR